MNLFKKFIFILSGFVVITSAYATNLKEDVDAVVNKAIREKRIVGAVILVYQDGKEIYRGALGSRDRENIIPMTDNTIFRFASLSKTITTVAALRLIDAGKLSLDDPVTKWLPGFKPKTTDGKTPVITIRQLLTHTSGLSYSFYETKNGPYHQLGVSDGLNKDDFSLNENMRRLGEAPLVSKPGTRWQYSLSTDVLGAVIEQVESKSLPEVVDEQVLIPLGMTHTGFILKDSSPVSIPYADNKPEPMRMVDGQEVPFAFSSIIFCPSRIYDKTAFASGGGSIYVKLLDSIRLGTIPLKKETLEKLTTNQIGNFILPNDLGWGWSLGFSVLKYPLLARTPQSKGTYQWGGIWGHAWWVDPTNKLTVVILSNTAIAGLVGRPFPNEVRNVIYADLEKK
jgi:CubicO group peptidase (beta-lactamase class C family)